MDRLAQAPDSSAGSDPDADLPLWYNALLARSTGRARSPAPPHPWRAEVARWPIPRRQRWGDRANELQDAGFDWKEAERVAFEELTDEPAAHD